MTIFDIIADILFLKKKTSLSNIDNEASFSPFMVNRWISMYSNMLALKCNQLNKFLTFNKQTTYSLFFNIFDKVPQRKINYYKKNKDSKEEENTNTLLCKALEISNRELNNYNDLLQYLKTELN